MPAPGTARAALAVFLRKGRSRKGLTYAELSRRTSAYSAATLQRAAGGRSVPSRQVARAYAMACGLDVDETDRLWLEARRAERSERPGTGRRSVPKPRMMRDLADLGAGLADAHERGGAPSRREMQRRATAAGTRLSSSAAQRIVTRRQIPSSREQLVAFLRACEVPERDHAEWERAWSRVRRHHAAELNVSRTLLDRQEAEAADSPSGRVTAEQAARLLSAAGYTPAEPYRGYNAPWTVRCRYCTAVKRIRLSDHADGRAMQCPQCSTEAERTVQRVWAALFYQQRWKEYGMPADEAEIFRRCWVAGVERRQSRLHVTVGAPSELFHTAGLADPSAWEALVASAVRDELDTVSEVVYVTCTDRLN
ncbi:Helix-turn-helix domain-containing protein [Streptomyces sp. Ncost-T6T-1]|uniref:helix-turn-helix domain-containing protein n=1 Tax=Streptomyces sp. Ncost-T6T-1 TaxID=1100828 RepID=UPI000805DF2D|nr:helix-turn-helix transcriptional regulator [Streptomyces sp. Ncost-T6T-1]SBU92797.1 Helix-turn-helix domain-containing protein [Streptomyces sp. Ncost-T6T-1]